MKWIIILVLIFVVSLGGGLIYTKMTANKTSAVSTKSNSFDKKTPTKVESKSKPQVIVGKNIFYVDVADTNEERAQGLSGKSNLEDSYGMLFDFKTQDIKPSFWMKDMLIPIDIIWINDGMVSQIHKNVLAEPGVPTNELKLYTPDTVIDYVLEVKAGISDQKQIKEGDVVVLKLASD